MNRRKTSKTKSLQKSDTISVSMDKATRDLVTKKAKAFGITKSALVRLLVLHGLKCNPMRKKLEELYQ